MRLTHSPIDRYVRAAEHYFRAEHVDFDEPSIGPRAEVRERRLNVWKRVMLIREDAWRISVGLDRRSTPGSTQAPGIAASTSAAATASGREYPSSTPRPAQLARANAIG